MEFKKINMNKIVLMDKKSFEDGDVFNLAKSIAICGMQSPITVRAVPLSDRYELIVGNKRFYAYRLLGFREIPALIISAEPNFARALLKKGEYRDFFEEADAIKQAITVNKLTIEEMASRTGYSEKEIETALRTAEMTEIEREMIKSHAVSKETVKEISFLTDTAKRTDMLLECIRKRLQPQEVHVICEKEALGGKILRKNVRKTAKFRDLRLFDNTLTRALSLLRSSGVNAEIKTEKGRGTTEYKIKIHS